jgi:hypothetical protein
MMSSDILTGSTDQNDPTLPWLLGFFVLERNTVADIGFNACEAQD